MKKVIDLSNYDADHDLVQSTVWPAAFLAAGIDGVIIGSQDIALANWQANCCEAAGLPILATYAEPNVLAAIKLAQQRGCRYVGLACEPGGISSRTELRLAVATVRGAGPIRLTPLIYANIYDYESIAGREFDSELRWLARYGEDDPSDPEPPFPGVAVHQYSSTIIIAGKKRDHNYWMIEEEDDMTPELRKELDDMKLAVFAGAEEHTDDRAAKLTLADYRIGEIAEGRNRSVMDVAASAAAVSQRRKKA